MVRLCQPKFELTVLLNTFLFTIFFNLISCPRVELLQYEDVFNSPKSLSTLNHNFSVILPLLTSTSLLCVFSENEELLTVLTRILKPFKTLIFDSLIQKNFKLCDSIIALDFYSSLNQSGIFNNLPSPTIYILNSSLTRNTTDIEDCLHLVRSREVVVIYLEDGSVYELGPVFPLPRCFRQSSVAEVLRHRVQPVKLDLAGSKLCVATMRYFPFFIVKDEENGEFDGIEEQLINEFSRHLNFSPHYLLYNSWGTLMPNGTWVGQIGEAMQEGRAEIAIANFWKIPSLYNAMDFGPSMTKNHLGFLVRRPEKIEFHWMSVLTIFKVWVWLATLLSLVLVVMVYWAGVNWDTHSHTESWAGSVMTVLGHLTMATSHCRVSDGNTRYTLTSWSVFSLLFTTSLSTGIVTRLTLPQYTERVDTIRQLVENHHYWTVEYYRRFKHNKLIKEFMFDFENPWAVAFKDSYTYLETEEVLKRAETDSKIAFPVERYGENVMVLNTQGLLELEALKQFRFCKETASVTQSSIGVKKNSLLFEELSVLNLKYLQIGLVEHWKDEVGRRWPHYDTSHLSVERDILTFGEPEQLLLDKVRPVFYLLLFGLGVAFLAFVVEVIW